MFSKKDLDNKIKEASEQVENQVDTRVSTVIGITLGVLFVTSMILSIVFNFKFKSDMNSLRAEYGEAFVDNKICMQIEIKTATILERISNSLVETDLGSVKVNKDPKSSVILVYRNFDNELELIDNINSKNNESYEHLEYITSDYKVPSGYTVLKTDYDRLRYRDYLAELDESLKYVKYSNIFKIISAVLISLELINMLYMFMLVHKYNKWDKILKLRKKKQDKDATANKAEKIEKKGIGADGKRLEEEAIRTVDESISSEGYTYKGVL